MRRLLPLGAALILAQTAFVGALRADSEFYIAGDLRDAPRDDNGRRGPRSWPAKKVTAKFWENIYQLEAKNAMYAHRHGGRNYVENIRKYLNRLPSDRQQDAMKRFLGISYSYRMKESPETEDARRDRHQERFNSMVREYYELAKRERVQNGNSTYEELFSSIRMLANVGPEGKKLALELSRLAPTNSRVQADLAQDFLDEGNIDRAVNAAKRSIELNPLSSEAHKTLAQAKYQREDFPGAYHAAKDAISLDPKDAVSFSIMKLSQSRVPGLGEETIDEIDEFPQRASGRSISGESRFASIPVDAQDRTALLDAAADAAFLNAGAASARNLSLQRLDHRLKSVMQRGDNEEAIALATRALQQNRGNWLALFRRAQAQLRRGNAAKALEDTRRAVELAGEDADSVLLTLHARVLNRLGRHEEALAASDAAMLRGTEDPKARARTIFQRAWSLAGMGRPSDALAALDLAAKLDMRYVAFYQELLTLPDDRNIAMLFAAQDNFGARPAAAAADSGTGDSKQRTLRIMMFSLAGGILVALGLLHVLSGTAKKSSTGSSLAVGNGGSGLIAGTYRVSRKIAQGGMGIVYEADDVHLERRVAIKKMREEISFDRRERERFLREARTVARLKHPNIVEIHSVVGEGDDIFLVFEYVDGHTVQQYIEGYTRIPFDQAVRVAQGAAAALNYAHKKGVIHRDLKPSNIMISSEGMVKVMDFGVARQAKESMSSVVSQTISGTPQYMPPEQEQGRVGEASDVYALAVCFYEMVTGEMPFAGTAGGMSINKARRRFKPATKCNPSLPTGLDQVLEWGLEPDPDRRCQSPMKFTAALEALLQPKVGPFDVV